MMKRAEMIVVLAKEPQPGRVKTRLQSRFSAEEAARLAAAAIRDTQRAVRASQSPDEFFAGKAIHRISRTDSKSCHSAAAPSMIAWRTPLMILVETAQQGCC